jgi:SAM-dependent methyltransferase
MSFRPNLQIAQFLATTVGADSLAKADALTLTPETMLTDLKILRQWLTPAQAAGVAEQIQLRRKGVTKFERADNMLFTHEALEQATDSRVAQYRAARFQDSRRVADLGCSIGGDSLWLAMVTDQVLGIDLDQVRLIFARHNAAAYNLYDKIAFIQADVCYPPACLNRFDAIFADPARRTEGRRTVRPQFYHPPLDKLMETYAGQPLGIKVAPGMDFSAATLADEIEVISLNGEVKEAVLWFRDLAIPGVSRRATLLPDGKTLTDETSSQCAIGGLGDYLYEPDPAVIRAGLVGQLGMQLDINLLDPNIAYLSGNQAIESPFIKGYQIEARLSLKVKQINHYLQQHQIGPLNVKQRGTGLSPERVEKQLKPAKNGLKRTLILIRIQDDHLALICDRL